MTSVPKESSEALFYNLSEIPFEPTGAATEKYKYVAPKKFNNIEDTIEEVVREKKLYVILFRAPQGGGKTATAAELRRRVDAKKYAGGKGAVISNKLIDLDFSRYGADFVREATPLLPHFKWEKYKGKTSPGELRNAISSVLKNLGESHGLIVWVIDEFDILVDHPKAKQSEFLQYLRDIVDELSNEKLPILFIMSHTVKSSKEFEKHLADVHGPFESRIVVRLDIGYTFPEVRNIVAERLRPFRKKESAYNSIEPFSEEAVKELYNLVMLTGGTGELNDFRLFERCCYFAVLEGARAKHKLIEREEVQRVFQEQYKSWGRAGVGEKLSLGVQSDRAGLLSAPPMRKNEAALRGLLKGLKLMRDFSEITDVQTPYAGKFGSDVHLSTLRFSANHKPTGKKVSVAWLLATKEEGIVLQNDLKSIDSAIPRILAENPTYSNLSILSYVSGLDLDTSQMTEFDRTIKISSETMQDIMSLGLESTTEDDVEILRKNFDADIAPLLKEIFEESTRDITKPLTDPVRRLAIALNVSQVTGSKLTKEALKEESKKLFGSASKIGDRHLSDLFALGFAKEQGTEIVPALPRALSRLDELLHKQALRTEDILKEFGPNGEAVLDAAKDLRLVIVDEDGLVRRRQDIRKAVQEHVETVKPLLSKEVKETFDGLKADQMVKAIGKVTPDDVLGAITYSAVEELLPLIEERLEKTGAAPTTAKASTTTAAPSAPSLPTRPQEAQPPDARKLGETVLSALKGRQPMTLDELKHDLISKGVPGDVNSAIISLILRNKLKLST